MLSSITNTTQTIGVVSTESGIGNSLITSILAVKMRSEGFRIAIIELTDQEGSISKYFGLPSHNQPVKSKISIEIVTLNPSNTSQLESIISAFKEQMDYIFIDMPPMLNLSVKLTNVICVTSMDKDIDKNTFDALNNLTPDPTHLAGIIVNKADDSDQIALKRTEIASINFSTSVFIPTEIKMHEAAERGEVEYVNYTWLDALSEEIII